jgi:aminoglycoside phosphotransferase family enzyme
MVHMLDLASRAETPRPALAFEDEVTFLRDPRHLPGRVRSVEVRETHMSWVFLTEDRVYKLKKPVRFPYLDFSTCERRAVACRAEHRLNRRLAPDVYLAVTPLTAASSGLAVDGDGPVIDWLVVMRRLASERSLEAVLLARRLQPVHVERIASTLREFYRHARPVLMPAERHLADWRRATDANRRVLCDPRFHLPFLLIGRTLRVQRRFLAERAETLAARVRAGRIVDAHGDLRPEHVWLTDPVTIIDCLEFDPRLRALDPLDDVAFLHLECERLGTAWAGERIRRHLAATLGEDRASGLFLFYRSQRAMLRARLSIAHLLDAAPRTPEKWPRQARAYLRLAARDAMQLDRLLRRPSDPSAAGCRAACG